MLTRLAILLILVTMAMVNTQQCWEDNVEFDGQTHSTSNARAAADCQAMCDRSRCSHWTWRGGSCMIKRIANPGNKVTSRGAVSGGKSSVACTEKVKGVACHYTDTKQPVLCIFPFKTLKPGSRTEKITHNTCIKRTTSSRHWTCATKLDITNTVVDSSLYNKDVDCGERTNEQGELYCSPGRSNSAGSCPELETYKKRVADLEKENKELKSKAGSTGQSPSCPAWGRWSSWGRCSRSCLQSRKRSCSKPSEEVEEKKCSTITCDQSSSSSSSSSSGVKTSKTSCAGRCGKTAPLGSCQCSTTCYSFGDCCGDYSSVCGTTDPQSCKGKCGNIFDRKLPCQCNVGCDKYKNCCKDYATTCSRAGSGSGTAGRPSTVVPSRQSSSGSNKNGVSDADLVNLFEDLFEKDQNNVADLLIINKGCSTRIGNPRDCSTHPLFSSVDSSIFRRPIYRKLRAVYDNYNEDTGVAEDRTRAERQEEDAFLDEVLASSTMKSALVFLKSKKLFNKSDAEFRKLLGELWFALYSRGNRILGSSGFEHVFLGEKKLGKVQGFHNWVYFYHLENLKKVNYLGHWEAKKLGLRGTGLSFTFKWGSEQKPYASMLIGTSPEFELALYTTCLLARGTDKCKVMLGGQPVTLTTHVFDRPGGVKYVASAFMDWE